ncbi:serrate RNA effector molecule homolog [Chrysoperla carnea]|uniref:serrate RNA effector molecule homolog n=1 Tax=Chrysoperla carnea TaxID=189513 RepID=UPI001D07AD92|nr:serrate RNA effector molecule homolog [Chrysoperla carnea]
MGDSEDEYDRKRRDKFRGERAEPNYRGVERPVRSRDDWQDREAWSRPRPRGEYRGAPRDRGYSPSVEPQSKRMRHDYYPPHEGYYNHYQPYHQPQHREPAPAPVTEGSQPPMMSFKAFLAAQDDNISDSEAVEKYNDYKLEFQRQQLNEFFVAHKDDEWFRLKYHPEDSVKRKEEQLNALKKRVGVFLELLDGGKLDNISVDCSRTDDLIKLLDTVVIKLEGGTEADLAVLDETPEVVASETEKKEEVKVEKVEKNNKNEKIEKEDKEEKDKQAKEEKALSDESNDVQKIDDPADEESQKSDDVKSVKDDNKGSEDGEESKENKSDDKLEDISKDNDEELDSSTKEDKNDEDEKMDTDPVEELDDSTKKDEDENDVEEKPEEKVEENGVEKAPEESVEPEEPKESKKEKKRKRSSFSGSESSSSSDSESEHEVEPEKKPEENEESSKEDGEKDEPEEGEEDSGKKSPEKVEIPEETTSTPKVEPPRALHKTTSIFLRNLAPTITRQEVEAMCSRYSGFLRVALADPQPERRWLRRGWVTFTRNANIKEICWNLNNIRLRDCELGAIVNRDLSRRIRQVNGITAHKQVVRSDIRISAKVALHLDGKVNLWVDENNPKTNQEQSFGLDSNNPVLKNITDYLIEEASAEEEELLGLESSTEQQDTSSCIVERDEQLIKVLDKIILYLRVVHSVDYYNHCEYPNEDEMPNRCGILHARGPPPLTKTDISTFMGSAVEAKMSHFLPDKTVASGGSGDSKTDKLVQLALKDEQAELDKFVLANTRELAKDKWLCPLSGKKFKGPDFVRKHIFNKHAEKVEEVKKEVQFFNNYLKDPKRPMLAEQQPVKREDSTPAYGGHPVYGSIYGYGGMPRGGYYNQGYGQRSRGYARTRGGSDFRPVVHYRDLDAPREPEEFI